MAFVVPPVVSFVSSALISAGASVAVAGTVAGVVGVATYFGATAAVAAVANYAIGKVFAKKPQQAAPFSHIAQDRTVMLRSAVANRSIIYGQVMVSGPLVFAASTGDTNEYIHLVVALSHGEVEEIGDVYLGDTLSDDARFSGLVRVNKHLGAAAQAADSDLVSEVTEWTTDHKLSGITYVYVRLLFDQDVFINGLPNIKAVVKGRKVYDPRDTNTVWSENWALCMRDYMTADFGLDADAAEVDGAEMTAAANTSEESVDIPGGTQERFTCNGVVSLGDSPADILSSMLTAGAGALPFIQGVYTLFAGEYHAPAVTLDESDLRAPIIVHPRISRKSLFNAVRGIFVDRDQYWQPADFPTITNGTYETQDGSQQIFRDIELAYTTDTYRAQRIGKIHLEKSRQGITVIFPAKLTALELTSMSTVMLTIDQLGWSSKVFRVMDWTLVETGGVDLLLQEEASASYDWESGDATTVDPAPDTNLPDPWTAAPPTDLTLSSGVAQLFIRNDGTIFSRIKAAWTAPADTGITAGGRIEVQYKKSADGSWENAASLDGAVIFTHILDIEDGVAYDVRIRGVNHFGVRSSWATVTDHTVIGKTAAPATVAAFSAQQNGDVVTFQWTKVADVDIGGYELRYAAQGAFVWGNATVITLETKGTLVTNAALPPGSWTLGIKAVDTSGNESATEKTFDIEITNPNNPIASQDEHPAWAGTLDGFILHNISNCLVPLSQNLASDDDWETFDEFVVNPVAEATYTAIEIDIGFDASGLRVWAEVTAALGPDTAGLADPIVDLDHKLAAGSYDGFEPWTVGVIAARYMKHRARIVPATGVAYLSTFTPKVDIPIREEQASGVTIGVGGTAIAFTERFHEVPSIQVTAEGASALYPVKSAPTVNGFTVKVYDSGGVDVGGTVDWHAIGA